MFLTVSFEFHYRKLIHGIQSHLFVKYIKHPSCSSYTKMDLIQENNNVLVVWDQSFDPNSINVAEIKATKKATIQFENVDRISLGSNTGATHDRIICNVTDPKIVDLYARLLKLLKPQGYLSTRVPADGGDLIKEKLKLSGFINVEEHGDELLCQKPNYEVGSAAKLSFLPKVDNNKSSISAAWKIDSDGEEIVDADDLLDEDDKVKPDPTSLKVCGTTGKRKACKDCSCGLAEELSGEGDSSTVGKQAPTSSCGSCYLGDAFRCASCPYLGMPAFKPGEKIQLAGGLLNDDI